MAAGKYRTIVADPPWDHSDGTGVNLSGGGKVTHLPYPTMSADQIAGLAVEQLAHWHAHLYLWTPEGDERKDKARD